MTILDREPDAITAPDLEPRGEPGAPPEHSGARREAVPFVLSDPGRVLLAALSAGAGAIHLAMVPSHAAEWMAEGIAFAVVGWLQILIAIAIVARPSRAIVRLSCLANVAFAAAWVVTRVWGPPFGPEAGVPHAASFVDIVCVSLEILLVVAGYELLAHPGRGARLSSGALAVLSIIPVAILVLATAAIVSPSAAGHAHSEVGEVADGHAHDDAAAAASGDDKGLSSIMNGQGDGGGHPHGATVVDVDADTQQRLDAQLVNTETLIAKYPTVAAAEADGFYRQGPFSPGLGAHYMSRTTGLNFDGTLEGDDFLHPTLIFDGVTPDAKLAGFMYMIMSTDTENAPEGFIGPNDHWHYHTNVCIVPRAGGGVDAPLGADTSAPKELCDKYEGGMLIANTGYMLHVWTVPGYESSQGTFSNVNPAITCPDGTYYVIPLEEIGSSSNVCKDVNT